MVKNTNTRKKKSKVKSRIEEFMQPGFTIVELLIVIVIIGVLASLTVVGYNGIKQRADNAARLNAARQAASVIRTYVTLNGDLGLPDTPPAGSNVIYCISDKIVVDYDNDGSKECGKVTNSAQKGTYSQTLIDKLKLVSPNLPSAAPNKVYPTNPHYGPVMFYYKPWKLDNETTPYILEYWLDGTEQRCAGGIPVVFSGPTGIERSNLPYSETDASTTYCYVALANLEVR